MTDLLEPDEPPKPSTWTSTAVQLLATLGPLVTVGTALLFYFGWVRSSQEATYLGFDDSVLQMSTQDYVLRSANALFLPAAVFVGLGLGSLVLHGWLEDYRLGDDPTGQRRRTLRSVTIALITAILTVPLVGGIISAIFPGWAGLVMPAAIAAGLLLSAYGVLLRRRVAGAGPRSPVDRRRDVAAGTLVALLVVLAVFWGTGNYAGIVGRGRGEQVGTHLQDLTGVVLYSPADLRISQPGVHVTVYADQNGAYRYRYAGLWLLQRSGGRLFLLPAGWTLDSGTLLVIPDNSSVRVEYTH